MNLRKFLDKYPDEALYIDCYCYIRLLNNNWYRRLGRRDNYIFGEWIKDFIWEPTQLNFIGASRVMKIVTNIYQA